MTSPSQTPSNRIEGHQKVRGILGLGGLAPDGVIRHAEGDHFQVALGDETTHEAMLDLCMKLNRAIDAEGLDWDNLDRATFTRLLKSIADDE